MNSNQNSTSTLQLEDVSLQRGKHLLFSNLNFEMAAGQTGVCLGKNGSGKTSLGLAICNLIPLVSGKINYQGQIAYCSQDPKFPLDLNCWDYLLQLTSLSAIPHRLQHNRVEDVIAIFDLETYIDHKIGTMSRGWLQRLNLARTWLANPDVLILDEPHTALDPEGMLLLKEALHVRQFTCLILSPPESPSAQLAPCILNLGDLS